MKNIIPRNFLFLILLITPTFYLNADYYENNDCGNPLNCGSFNVLVHGGIAPTLWRNRGNFSAISCNAATIPDVTSAVVDFFQLPKFNKLFHAPWIIGGQLGYAVSDCMEVYAEVNYRQASTRIFTALNVAIPLDTVNATLTFNNKFKAIDAYIGARAYWGRYWCDRLAFFIGGKFGLVHHKAIGFNYNIIPTIGLTQLALVSTTSTPFFLRNNSPAGGGNIGLDWCFSCGFSLVLMAEVVATCGPKSDPNIPLTNTCTQLPSILPSNFLIGGTGTELFFPITLGLKYSF